MNTRKIGKKIPETHFYNGRNMHPPRVISNPYIAEYMHPGLEKLRLNHAQIGYHWYYLYHKATDTRAAFVTLNISSMLKQHNGDDALLLILQQIAGATPLALRAYVTRTIIDTTTEVCLAMMSMVPVKDKGDKVLYERET